MRHLSGLDADDHRRQIGLTCCCTDAGQLAEHRSLEARRNPGQVRQVAIGDRLIGRRSTLSQQVIRIFGGCHEPNLARLSARGHAQRSPHPGRGAGFVVRRCRALPTLSLESLVGAAGEQVEEKP